MEQQNVSFSSEIPPQGHSDDAAAQQIAQSHSSTDVAQSTAKHKHKMSNLQDSDYDSEGRKEKATRKKTCASNNQASSSKLGRGKVFTEQDEIAILSSLCEYIHRNNILDASSINWNKVRTYLTGKGNLSSGFTTNQIYEKVRRLKKKYSKNVEKENIGKGPILNSQHDIDVFEISNKIWGSANSDWIESDNEVLGEEEEDMWNNYPYLYEALDSFEHLFPLKDNLRYIGTEKAKELEMKWMELMLEENKLHIKKIKLESGLTKTALDEMKRV